MKKIVITVICIFTAICCVTGIAAYTFEWPASAVVTETGEIRFSAVRGLAFMADCAVFENKLGLPKGGLDGISLTYLPDNADVYIGITPVKECVTLTREQIDNMRLIFTDDTKTAELGFLPDCNGAIPTIAKITALDSVNKAPLTESGRINVIKNTPSTGKITAYDPDGDMIFVKVTCAPQKGMLTTDGLSFKYNPYKNQTGNDSFRFTVIDMYGNTSREAKFDVVIEKENDFVYADMLDNNHHYAAVKLNERNIYSGVKLNGRYYFNPGRQMTRGEFVMLIIAALGYNDLENVVNTGLTGDSGIPMYMKPYVKKAVDLNIITEDYFNFDEIPQNCESVVMIHRAARIADVGQYNLPYSDVSAIPEWALQSYMTLTAYKMLDLYSNTAKPLAPLTNDTAAGLAWQLTKQLTIDN